MAKLEEITNAKNEKFQTNNIGDPNHPNCEKCQYHIALLYRYNPDVLLSRHARKPSVESFCTKKKVIVSKKNINTCQFEDIINGKKVRSFKVKETKVESGQSSHHN